MRLCHVTPHLPPDQAANALLPAELGRWHAARGVAVSFVAHEPAQGAPAADAGLPGRVEWVARRGRESSLARRLRLGTLGLARSVSRALDRVARDADLLHLHSNGLIIEVASAWAGRRGLPTILTLYGTEVWHYRPRWPIDPFRRAYDRASHVTFYSQGLLNHARQIGLDRPGLSVVYPAVAEAFQPRDTETRETWKRSMGLAGWRVILNVKRLHPLAGQDILIDAFARLAGSRPDVRLVICGTGPMREALEDQARRTGVGNRVTFTGLVANAEVARLAAVADVFALPSRLEALPTVAVEALAAGTPVVSADHPGGVELHELFGDDVRLVPRERADELAGALTDLLDRPRRATSQTRDLVRSRFGPDAVDAAYAALYDRFARSRR